MPRKPAKESPHKLRPDAAEIAYRTMLEATGQAPKTRPGKGEKNPHAVERGRKGGKRGGLSRAQLLTPEQRKLSAQSAARSRWSKQKEP